jgi:hypothetical protein
MALVPLAAGPASAAPPGNDEVGGAIALNLGDRVTEDTTQATTNAGDDALNAACGAPVTEASVWYSYHPLVRGDVLLDASKSDYRAGIMVFQGTPTADSLIACGPGEVGLRLQGGQTYYVMAFSDTQGVDGGNLVLSLKNAPPPRVHVGIAKRGKASHSGAARLHGTYFCKGGVVFTDISAKIRQRAGRLKIQGEHGTQVRCNGKRHPWSMRIFSPTGTYAGGRAVAKVKIFACGILVCRHEGTTRQHITLVGHGPSRRGIGHPTTARQPRAHPLLGFQKHWPRG